MRIEASSIDLVSSWRSDTQVRERLSIRPSPGTRVPDKVELREGTGARTRVRGDEEMEDTLPPDSRLRLLMALVERMTGRRIRLPDTPAGKRATTTPSPPTETIEDVRIEYRRTRIERESVSFTASGSVRLASGRTLQFRLAFTLNRSRVEQVSIDAGMRRDPLVLDFADHGALMAGDRIRFDLNGDGEAGEIPVPASGRGFLVLDRNGNGKVDDGGELFGPRSGDAFAELAALDADGNGWIDEADPAFSRLGLWNPSREDSLRLLGQAGVGALHTGRAATPYTLERAGEVRGWLRESGIYLGSDGRVGTLSRIDLKV